MTQDRPGDECTSKSFITASIKIKNQSEEQDNVMVMTEGSNLEREVPRFNQAHFAGGALSLQGIVLETKGWESTSVFNDSP